MRQLETALLQCKEEIKTYLGALEDSRDKYDRDIRHKEEMVKWGSMIHAAEFNKIYTADAPSFA